MANPKSYDTYLEEFNALVEAEDFVKAVKKGNKIIEKFPAEAKEQGIDLNVAEFTLKLKEESLNVDKDVSVLITANHTVGIEEVIIGQEVKMKKSFFDAVYSTGKMSRYAKLAE